VDEESIERGRRVLDEMSGGRGAEIEARWEALHPDLARLITGFVAGEIWSRPRLDRKTRSLVTIAAMTALGRPKALELNLRLALGNGASREEIVEVLFQMAVYAGFPACWEALEVAARIFAEETPPGGV
jgi:4-carboxymuconolactone decarboxylase